MVSVPLRGNGFETSDTKKALIRPNDSVVSVPLRGNGFETVCISDWKMVGYMSGRVSVPLRGNGFETVNYFFQRERTKVRFPSPCGVMGLKPDSAPVQTVGTVVSVPLRGNGFET